MGMRQDYFTMGAQLLVLVSIYQGNHFWGFPILDPNPVCAIVKYVFSGHPFLRPSTRPGAPESSADEARFGRVANIIGDPPRMARVFWAKKTHPEKKHLAFCACRMGS